MVEVEERSGLVLQSEIQYFRLPATSGVHRTYPSLVGDQQHDSEHCVVLWPRGCTLTSRAAPFAWSSTARVYKERDLAVGRAPMEKTQSEKKNKNNPQWIAYSTPLGKNTPCEVGTRPLTPASLVGKTGGSLERLRKASQTILIVDFLTLRQCSLLGRHRGSEQLQRRCLHERDPTSSSLHDVWTSFRR